MRNTSPAKELRRSLGRDQFARRANQKNLSSPLAKNISLPPSGKSGLLARPVSPDERGIAHVTNARWDAVDAKAATDERGFGGRRSRVVLAPRCWRQACGAIRK